MSLNEKDKKRKDKVPADIPFGTIRLCPTHGSFRNPLEVARWIHKNNEAKKGWGSLIQSNKCYGRFGTYLNEKIVKLFATLETHLVIRNPESVHETLNSRET